MNQKNSTQTLAFRIGSNLTAKGIGEYLVNQKRIPLNNVLSKAKVEKGYLHLDFSEKPKRLAIVNDESK